MSISFISTLHLSILTILFTLSGAAATDFINASCRRTSFPSICTSTLSSYSHSIHHNPHLLVLFSLSVSEDRARAASAFVSHLSSTLPTLTHEGGAVRDCLQTLRNSVDRLRGSYGELKLMGRGAGSKRFQWHLRNVETWVSAALTNENTCLESLAEDETVAGVRAAIRRRILDVARVTSNALALVNQLWN